MSPTGRFENEKVQERTAELTEAAAAAAAQADRERAALLGQMVRQNAYLAALHEVTLGLITRLDYRELLEADHHTGRTASGRSSRLC